MSFDQDIGLGVFCKYAGYFSEIYFSFFAQYAGVDLKQQSRVEGHINSFSHPRDRGIGYGLLDLLRLLVHMMSDQVSRSSSHSRADQGPPYRALTAAANKGARGRACAR